MKTNNSFIGWAALLLLSTLNFQLSTYGQGTAFTYQGRLTDGTNAANGSYDLTFSLFSVSSGAGQVGSTYPSPATAVSNGLFTVTLDFGANFPGANRWLEIGMRTNGGGAYTTLTPRQALTATPYAIQAGNAGTLGGQSATAYVAKAGDTMTGNLNIPGLATLAFGASTRQMISLYDKPGYNFGIGVQTSTFYQRTDIGGGFAWYEGGVHSDAQNNAGGGTTLMTLDENGDLHVNAMNASGGYAVWGNNPNGGGVYGSSGSAFGVYGGSATASGVEGHSGSGYGVYGESSGAGLSGVYGISHSSTGSGVVGEIFAASPLGAGVTGIAHGGAAGLQGIAVEGTIVAGWFDGRVEVTTDLWVYGNKHFKIDHPLDPANKYLLHSCVESPDVKNLYDGNVTTDANGEAIVALPTYFEVLNRDFRYQLTVLGQFAQAIVSTKIKGNQFTIKTDKPNVEVSWQVTGIRQDAYMKAHPMVVEQDKPANERGTYQHPELFGQPEEKGLSWSQNPELWKRLKKERVEQAALPKP